jgi:steroid delta-isomerase-like uncharacterized protein
LDKLVDIMTEDICKKIVLQYVDAFNRGDMEALREFFTPDALIYGVLGWGEIDKAIAIWKEILAAFAIQLHVESIIVQGDTVAVLYTERGISHGAFRGQPATGKVYEIVAMEWFIIQDGKIHRRWGARDSAAQFRQMGLSLG